MKAYSTEPTGEYFEAQLNDSTVVRVERKVFNVQEYINVHLWGKDAKGKPFPRRGRGLCLLPESWDKILKIFSEHGFPGTRTRTENEGTL